MDAYFYRPAVASSALLCAGLSGCVATVRINQIAPANQPLPPSITRVATVDRVQSAESAEAISAFAKGLARAPTLSVVEGGGAQAAYDRARQRGALAVLKPIPVDVLGELCQAVAADGVVALEDMGSGEQWRFQVSESPNSTIVVRATNAAHWLVYDCKGKTYADKTFDAIPTDAGFGYRVTGAQFADELVPHEVAVDRHLYWGTVALRTGSLAAAAGDWKEARRQWETELENPKDKLRGRALYNLAVGAEEAGDLDGALTYVRKADDLLKSQMTADYRRTLLLQKRAVTKSGNHAE